MISMDIETAIKNGVERERQFSIIEEGLRQQRKNK